MSTFPGRRAAPSWLRPGAGGAAVPAVLALVLLVGCAGGEDATRPPGELPTIREPADVQLPMDHYLYAPDDAAVIGTAKDELVAACMERHGFPGYPVPDFSVQAGLPRHTFGIGTLFDVDQARAHGFTPPWAGALEDESAAHLARFADWGGDEVRRVLVGEAALGGGRGDARDDARVESELGPLVPTGGCLEDAHRELFELAGHEPHDNTWAGNAADVAIATAREDRRMDGPRVEWSACMGSRGHEYRDPADAQADERWLTDLDGARDVAVASAECVRESRYVDTWMAIAAERQHEFIEENAERLEGERRLRQDMLEAVRERGLGNVGGRPGGPPPAG